MLQEAQFATQRHHHILIHLGSTLCYTCIRSVAVPNCTSLCKEEVYCSIGSVKQIKRDRMKKKKKGVCRDFRVFFVIMFPSKDTSFGRVLHSTMSYLPAPGKPAALLPQESSTSDFPVFLFGNTSQN